MTPVSLRNPVNSVLRRLPSAGRHALAPLLRTQRIEEGTVLTRRLRPVTHAWFPHFGLISLTISTADGRWTEVAAIGHEGVVGVEAAFDPSVALSDSAVQIAGEFSVIRSDHLRSVASSHRSVEVGLCRYLRALTAQLQQSVACSNLHSLDQRCCRWLTTAQARSRSDELPVTQETLAGILGTGRPTVTLVLRKLAQAGLIRQHRGRILIISRDGLIARACECQDAVDRLCTRLDAVARTH